MTNELQQFAEYVKKHYHQEVDPAKLSRALYIAKNLDEHGGELPDPEIDPKALEEVDFITYPEEVEGANCFNCEFMVKEKGERAHCDLKKIRGQPVTARNCCAKWDGPGTIRHWEDMGYESGEEYVKDLRRRVTKESLRNKLPASEDDASTTPDPIDPKLWQQCLVTAQKQAGIIDGLTVKFVDFAPLKVKYAMDLIEGTNGFVRDFVPKNEVWIDSGNAAKNWPYVLYHELFETRLMKGGETYEEAHLRANAAERELRSQAIGHTKQLPPRLDVHTSTPPVVPDLEKQSEFIDPNESGMYETSTERSRAGIPNRLRGAPLLISNDGNGRDTQESGRRSFPKSFGKGYWGDGIQGTDRGANATPEARDVLDDEFEDFLNSHNLNIGDLENADMMVEGVEVGPRAKDARNTVYEGKDVIEDKETSNSYDSDLELREGTDDYREDVVPEAEDANTKELPPNTVAIDFDGTISDADHFQPLDETKPRHGVKDALRKFQSAGIKILIWTAREDTTEVEAWLNDHHIPFDAINDNPFSDMDSRKIEANVYIDDRAVEASSDTSWSELSKEVMQRIFGDAQQPIDESDGYEELEELAATGLDELKDMLKKLDYPFIYVDELRLGELEAELQNPGGVIIIPPIKKKKRAKEKVEADYSGDWSQLLDMVRAGVAVDSLDQLYQDIGRVGGVYARFPKDRFKEPLANGYRDYLVNYKMPSGLIVEVQYHLKPILIAREKERLAYDVVRAIKASMEEEGRTEMTPGEAEACRRASKDSEHLFSRAWEEAKKPEKKKKSLTVKGIPSRLPYRPDPIMARYDTAELLQPFNRDETLPPQQPRSGEAKMAQGGDTLEAGSLTSPIGVGFRENTTTQADLKALSWVSTAPKIKNTLKGSYFGECDRDELGHCKPSGQADTEGAGEGTAAPAEAGEETAAPKSVEESLSGIGQLLSQKSGGLPKKASNPVEPNIGYQGLKDLGEEAQKQYQALLDLGKGIGAQLGFKTVVPKSVDEFIEAVSGEGGVVLIAPLKSQKRAEEKVNADYKGDWRKLTDMVRGSIAVDTVEQLYTVVDKLVNEYNVSLAAAPKDRITQPLPTGYRDIMLHVQMPNGMPAELQLHVKPMILAKELKGHKPYEAMRSIDAKMESEGRTQMTDEEKVVYDKSLADSQVIYNQAWEQASKPREAAAA